jgi:hypothetical protein
VVGCGDGDGVNAAVVEDAAQIGFRAHAVAVAFLEFGGAGSGHLAVGIAEHGDLNVGQFLESGNVVATASIDS